MHLIKIQMYIIFHFWWEFCKIDYIRISVLRHKLLAVLQMVIMSLLMFMFLHLTNKTNSIVLERLNYFYSFYRKNITKLLCEEVIKEYTAQNGRKTLIGCVRKLIK